MADEDHSARGDIVRAILIARNRAVLLDADLAALYGVTTKALNQAVKRNLARFPSDFAFRLTSSEFVELSGLAGPSAGQRFRNLRSPPVAFTEHGARERIGKHDAEIATLLRAMRELMGPAKSPSRGIGFLADIK